MNILFGTRVSSSDQKELGILKELLVHPDTRAVAYLVVQRGLFFPTDTLVPIGEVTGATEDEILVGELAATITNRLQELSAPETQPRRSLVPPGFAPGEIPPPVVAPDDTVAVDHDTPVQGADGGTVGRIAGVTTCDGEITQIRLKGSILRSERLIPEKFIGTIEDNYITLNVTLDELEKLAPAG